MKDTLKNFVSRTPWRKKKLKVYALDGKTGTGKSFRARLLTEKYNIDLLIDDGLLIKGHHILAGRSSKREKNRVTAIKRAIIDDPEHAEEIIFALRKEKFHSILVLGTSDKMIGRIVERLQLPYPDEIIHIEDIASTEEIEHAMESRNVRGKHVIPVPVIEVRQDPAQRILDSIKFFIQQRRLLFWKEKVVEKTIVQPPYTRRGRLSISEYALSQMIMHCVKEYAREIEIDKILIELTLNGYIIEVKLCLPYGLSIPETLTGMHDYIINNVERFSGVRIEELHLTVSKIDSPWYSARHSMKDADIHKKK